MMSKVLKNKFLAGSIIILCIWYVIHILIQSSIVPSPYAAFVALFRLLPKGILAHILVSLYRISVALLISLALGVPLGLWAGLNKKADSLFSPIVYILYPIPKVALLPIFMLLLGLGDSSKIVLVTSIIIFQVLLAARDGAKEISNELFLSVKSLGLNRKQIYAHLVFPAVLPKLLSSIRISMGISMSVLFFAETFATRFGIGYFIMNNWVMVNYIDMYAGILAMSIMGILLFAVVDAVESRLCRWLFVND